MRVALMQRCTATPAGDRAISFRRLFKRKGGLIPAAYRRKFAGIAAPQFG